MRNCLLCGRALAAQPLICLPNAPCGAQDLPTKENCAEERGFDLKLCQCRHCGMVQLDSEPVPYYRDVIRAVGLSTTMRELRTRELERFIHTYGLENKKIVEIGCGQGEYLELLASFPVEAYGLEHRACLVKAAKEKGLQAFQGFTETADTVLPGAPFDAFVMFNFLEHQPQPNEMLQCIYRNLTENGVGLLTVPGFEYVLEQRALYELVRDHIAYYTADTLRHLFEQNGFAVKEWISAVNDTHSFIVQKRPLVDIRPLKDELEVLRHSLREYAAQCKAGGRTLAVWGASHQAFTVLSSLGLAESVRYVIDSADFKQGRLCPASHVRIVAPELFLEDPVDCVLIIAPSYAKEIAGIARARFGAAVKLDILEGTRIVPWEN